MNIVHKIPNGMIRAWATDSLEDPLALTFSRCVATVFSWEHVSCYILGRENLTPTELLELSVGGKTDINPLPDDLLIEHCLALSRHGGGFWLTEDWIARPHDLALLKYNMPTCFFGDEVHYVTGLSDPRQSPNFKRIFCNRTPLFHGFYIYGAEMPLLHTEITLSQLQQVAKSVRKIVFGIYDAESYLICEQY
jgi:hypothetical protein